MSIIYEIDSSIFRDYDIRGIVNTTLFIDDAYLIGKAIASIINIAYQKKSLTRSPVIALGYDGRISSLALAENFIRGVSAMGVDIINLGLISSPALYYANYHFDIDGGVMITGSHNPKNYNGFKINVGNKPFYASQIKNLEKIIRENDFSTGPNNIGKILNFNNTDYIEYYIENIITRFIFPENFSPTVIWDAGNGVTAPILDKIVKKLPGKHILINNIVDGNFPAHHPDPTIIENLQDLALAAKKYQADLAIAFDGDGDRIGCIDKDGEILFADKLLMIFAKDILDRARKAKIIADVKMSDTCFEYITKHGGTAIMSRTGHSYIKDMMQKEDAMLACEMSGHIFFRDNYHGFDDALYAAVRLLHIISTKSNIIEEVKNHPTLIGLKETKIACEENIKFVIMQEIQNKMITLGVEFCGIDGVRVREQNGWWLIRASNTQAALIICCEATDENYLTEIKQKIVNLLKNYPITLPLELQSNDR